MVTKEVFTRALDLLRDDIVKDGSGNLAFLVKGEHKWQLYVPEELGTEEELRAALVEAVGNVTVMGRKPTVEA